MLLVEVEHGGALGLRMHGIDVRHLVPRASVRAASMRRRSASAVVSGMLMVLVVRVVVV